MFVRKCLSLTTSAITDHIPKPAALDGLVGHQVHFVHVCHTYVWCTYTSAWKLAPQGPIPLQCFF